jgi:endonuclease YncB( thermonuclease family)
VLYIDYGDTAWCSTQQVGICLVCFSTSLSQLRRPEGGQQAPCQGIGLQLAGVRPLEGVRWGKAALALLSSTLVGKELRVEVVGPSLGLPLLARVRLAGVDVAEMLLENGFAARRLTGLL